MLFLMIGRIFTLFLLSTVFACAQATSRPVQHIPDGVKSGAGFNAETATRAYLATVPADKKAQSDAYFEGGYWLILWDFLYGAAISLFLLYSRLSAKMRDLSEKTTRFRPLQTWLYWAQYALLVYVLGFPLAVYEGFMREHKYGLSNMAFGSWFTDEVKGLLLNIVLGGLVVAALFGIVRRLPRTWHIWGAAVAMLFAAIAVMLTPVYIMPLFNKYTVLTDPGIRDPILRLARQNGIPATKVYKVDASRQSKRVSANVSGFLGTERITLNDNLLNRASPQAIEMVMGHEMGHYVLNHIYKMLVFFLLVTVVFFAILRWGLTRALARWGARWGIRGIDDVAVLPLAMLILAVLGFVYTPVNNTMIRTQEYEADVFGVNTSRQPDGMAESALLLGEYRKLEPGPIEEMLFFDHPSGHTRIFTAMRWKAENPK